MSGGSGDERPESGRPDGSPPPHDTDGETERAAPVQATLRASHRRRFNLIWIIPIVTVAIGLYLAITTIRNHGPTITITFNSAEGLKAGQSQVRHKDVVLGTVRNIRLSDDFSHVIVTAELHAGYDRLLTSTTRIWVVKPRFFAGNISGFETLLSGAYIDLLPGAAGGKSQRDFTGLENPPVLEENTPGRTFVLRADRLGSLSQGSPVFYRDMSVGEVLGWDVGEMANYVTLRVFVRAPFDKYVHERTHFWNASGVNVSLSGTGLQVQVESLRAILLGGIAFDNPPKEPTATEAAANQEFPLYKDKEAADSASYGKPLYFEAFFEGSVRGLSQGATVDLRGIKIGQVTGISLRYDRKNDRVLIPVQFEVQPDRIADNELATRHDVARVVSDLVRRGLRAQLTSANLITGAQSVSLDIDPDAPPAEMTRDGDRFVIPSLRGGGLDNITASISQLLQKVNAIPFKAIGDNLNTALAGVAGVANGAQLRGALTAMQQALASVQDLTQKLDREASPALARLPAIAQSLSETVAHANRLVSSVDTGYGGDSRFKRDLDRLLAQLNETASSVRVLADLLTRHPEALIRGRTNTGAE
ncbi:PqiB family protein [Acidisphaera rubrifaciens]|uniref:Paraquat-inducible protein B n=1 Tax=Acidisphaera rubrifaciens HS-AP3 TaxID=1231350 RepID=A0A0D6P486_9PROT|nr:MlaD family protein [Acidisphaera rubrifaciens]GAN76482.1 paraquat-inducible protein B [Acidisphaera rubrifaciens HS-AP3]